MPPILTRPPAASIPKNSTPSTWLNLSVFNSRIVQCEANYGPTGSTDIENPGYYAEWEEVGIGVGAVQSKSGQRKKITHPCQSVGDSRFIQIEIIYDQSSTPSSRGS